MSIMNVIHRRPLILGACLAIAIAAIGGYSLSERSATAESPGPGPTDSAAASVPPETRAFVDSRLSLTSREQADALSDYVVTYGEREAAELRYVACGKAAGYAADVYPGAGQRITRVSFRTGDTDGVPDAETADRANAALQACRQQHLDDVDIVWAAQRTGNQPDAPTVSALFDRLEQCIQSGGAPQMGSVPAFALTYRNYANAGGRALALTGAGQEGALAQCGVQEEELSGMGLPLSVGDACASGAADRASAVTRCLTGSQR